jgi:hypothetical protein
VAWPRKENNYWPSEYDEVFEIVDQNPIQLKNALSEIQQKLGKTICLQP